MRLTRVALLLLSLSWGSSVVAEDKSLKDQIADFTTDLSLPASPAAAHVGLSQENVLMPRNRRAFEAGLSQIASAGGKPVGTIEFSPHDIARGASLSYVKYRDDWWYQTRTKMTIGVASGKRKVESAELSATGYSLSSVLIDLGDPVYSHALQVCIQRVQDNSIARVKRKDAEERKKKAGAKKAAEKKAAKAKADGKGTGDKQDEGEEELLPATDDQRPFDPADAVEDTEAQKEYKACVSAREPTLWNRTRVSFGLAKGSGREVAAPKRRIDFGESVWLSAQYGFEGWDVLTLPFGTGDRWVDCKKGTAAKCDETRTPSRLEQNAMATFHVRHTRGASDLDLSVTGALPKQDSTLAALRFTYGSDKRNIFLETSRSWVKVPGTTKRMDQHAFGASFWVREGLWVNAVNGRRKSFVNGTLDNVLELSLQFGASQAPAIASPKPAPASPT